VGAVETSLRGVPFSGRLKRARDRRRNWGVGGCGCGRCRGRARAAGRTARPLFSRPEEDPPSAPRRMKRGHPREDGGRCGPNPSGTGQLLSAWRVSVGRRRGGTPESRPPCPARPRVRRPAGRDRESLPEEGEGRQHQPFPGELAEALVGQPANGAGRADNAPGRRVPRLRDLVCAKGSSFARVDDHGPGLAAGVEEHEAAARVAGRTRGPARPGQKEQDRSGRQARNELAIAVRLPLQGAGGPSADCSRGRRDLPQQR
jgi:hypothetical protein